MVKLGDFGISKQLEGSKANTVLGTPYYISPEMVHEPSSTKYWLRLLISEKKCPFRIGVFCKREVTK